MVTLVSTGYVCLPIRRPSLKGPIVPNAFTPGAKNRLAQESAEHFLPDMVHLRRGNPF